MKFRYNYKGCLNWDEIKQEMDKWNKQSLEQKKKVAYFKGTHTGQRRSKIRTILAENPKRNVVIKLDAWKRFEPMTAFCKYQKLLNLPGRYEWSNRLKFLFLTKSIVFNISVKIIGYHRETKEVDYIVEKWHSFIDLFVEPNIDYKDYLFTLHVYKGEDEEFLKEIEAKMAVEYNNLIDAIEAEANRTPTQEDKEMIQRGFDKVSAITMDTLYDYIESTLRRNQDLFAGYESEIEEFINSGNLLLEDTACKSLE
jgi:hypothetical protein